MSILSNPEKIKQLDPDGMYDAILCFPEQIRSAIKIANELAIDSSDYSGVKHIIICGMGGSAIGGELAASLLKGESEVPITICRDYNIPAYAGKDTLVIASSYSGNTEETLSAFGQAQELGCRLFAITTGGKLQQIASENNIPQLAPHKGLQPRAALGYSFVLLMMLLYKIGYSKHTDNDLMAMAAFLKRRSSGMALENPIEKNVTKQLAQRMHNRIPIIYSGPSITEAVAVRFRGQIAENAKVLAFSNSFPEFNHNELVGWEKGCELRDKLLVIVFRDQGDNQRIKARMDIVEGLIAQKEVDVIEIESVGQNRLERMFSLIQVADFSSYYLALLNNVDPTPVQPIEQLKRELGKIE